MLIGCMKAFMSCKQGIDLTFSSLCIPLPLQPPKNNCFAMFDIWSCVCFRITESSRSSRDQKKTRKQLNDESGEQGSWIADGRKALTQRAGEFLRKMEQDLDLIAKDYSSLQEEFISQLPVQKHVDLKFLFFRLDFNEFYGRLSPSM